MPVSCFAFENHYHVDNSLSENSLEACMTSAVGELYFGCTNSDESY